MKKNEKFVITINREVGSGGRSVGEKLAARLGVPFYDKALITALREKYHLTTDEIEKMKGRSHSWWADFKRSLAIGEIFSRAQNFDTDLNKLPDVLSTSDMFRSEVEILEGIAAEESCVIAGRSAFYVFKDTPNHLNILIQASKDYRINRIMAKQQMSHDEALQKMEEIDQMRENYVKKYMGTTRYDARNYDLVFSMDGLTEDDVVDLILMYVK